MTSSLITSAWQDLWPTLTGYFFVACWCWLSRARVDRATPTWCTPRDFLELSSASPEAVRQSLEAAAWRLDHSLPGLLPYVCFMFFLALGGTALFVLRQLEVISSSWWMGIICLAPFGLAGWYLARIVERILLRRTLRVLVREQFGRG